MIGQVHDGDIIFVFQGLSYLLPAFRKSSSTYLFSRWHGHHLILLYSRIVLPSTSQMPFHKHRLKFLNLNTALNPFVNCWNKLISNLCWRRAVTLTKHPYKIPVGFGQSQPVSMKQDMPYSLWILHSKLYCYRLTLVYRQVKYNYNIRL